MFQIKDILSQNIGDVCAILIAAELAIDLKHAQWLLRHYGHNYILTPNGICMPYNERTVRIMRTRIAKCVVVTDNAELLVITKDMVKRRRIDKESVEAAAESRKFRREMVQRKIDREREQMFEDCQGRPSPKRQGKGDGLGDIGRYKGTGPRTTPAERVGLSPVKCARIILGRGELRA